MHIFYRFFLFNSLNIKIVQAAKETQLTRTAISGESVLIHKGLREGGLLRVVTALLLEPEFQIVFCKTVSNICNLSNSTALVVLANTTTSANCNEWFPNWLRTTSGGENLLWQGFLKFVNVLMSSPWKKTLLVILRGHPAPTSSINVCLYGSYIIIFIYIYIYIYIYIQLSY